MEEYLTPKDVKDILKFSMTKTYALINQDDFPKIKIGKDFRIPQTAFEEFMKKLTYKTYEIW